MTDDRTSPFTFVTSVENEPDKRPQCAHRSGIERVEVTQPKGEQYEWWRCLLCHCEFKPTGQLRPGDGPGDWG